VEVSGATWVAAGPATFDKLSLNGK
jgi:hypothetical protein